MKKTKKISRKLHIHLFCKDFSASLESSQKFSPEIPSLPFLWDTSVAPVAVVTPSTFLRKIPKLTGFFWVFGGGKIDRFSWRQQEFLDFSGFLTEKGNLDYSTNLHNVVNIWLHPIICSNHWNNQIMRCRLPAIQISTNIVSFLRGKFRWEARSFLNYLDASKLEF